MGQPKPRTPGRTKTPKTSPLTEILEAGFRDRLAQYQRWREKLPLEERFAELLWSPAGMNLEVPTPTIMVWDAARQQSIEQPVDGRYWTQRQLARQKQHGDGRLKARAKKQQGALESCKSVVEAPLRRMRAKAERSRMDWAVKLRDQEAACDKAWRRLKADICAIGERYRDEYLLRLFCGSRAGGVRQTVREKYKVRVAEGAMLPPVALHRRFVADHLGGCVDAEAQAYLDALNRVAELWPRIRPRLDFSVLLPKEATDRGGEGKPQPPVSACKNALRALRPKLPPSAIQGFLVAWSLRKENEAVTEQ